MKIDKLRSVRDGHRKNVENQLERIERAKENSSLVEFHAILESINSRAETLNSLNERILEMTEVSEVEQEIVSSEEYALTLEIKLRELRAYSEKSNIAMGEQNTSSRRQGMTSGNDCVEVNTHDGDINTNSISSANSSHFHRLPKLSLPIFDGNILQWQTFLDSFNLAVHTNPSLTDVQKFNYLRSQLEHDAARTIEGFALTNSNYARAIDLLRERYGQVHKITHSYMQALLQLPSPSNTLHGLRTYYDGKLLIKMENYIRGLESLGQYQESFGTLLVPVIFDKLPAEIRKTLARQHRGNNLSLNELRASISEEINVMEAGQISDVNEYGTSTMSLLTGSGPRHHKNKRRENFTQVEHRNKTDSKHSSHVLLKTAVAPVSTGYSSVDANILFDEGSQRSFITSSLADELNVTRTGTDTIHLASFGSETNHVRHLDTATVSLVTTSGDKMPMQVLIVPTKAVPLRNYNQDVTTLPYLRGLRLAHPITNDISFEVQILIGADYYWKIVEDEIIRGSGPTAVKSKVGYLLSGPIPSQSSAQYTTTSLTLNVLTQSLHDIDLEKLWKLESLGIQHDDTDKDDRNYMTHYQENSITFTGDKYTAQLPWKLEHQPLPTNYDIVKRRTENLIKRLRQDPITLKHYGDIIEDQEKRGFIEEVTDTDTPRERVHYIPHHAVKKDSSTTPIRIVYDCSCRMSRNHPSLNDCLQSTPPELNDLTAILVRFRVHKFAVVTDIEKAFLHVGLHEKDRDVTRFLWLSDPSIPDSPLKTYRFKSVLFGAVCSPFILNATLLKHIQRNRDKWVSRKLQRDLYVDNFLSSFDTEADVSRYFRESRDLMSAAGFTLRSWNSNSTILRETAKHLNILDKDEITKVLGMRWEPENDILTYTDRMIDINPIATKRFILQSTSRIYDPLSLLSPVTVRAKLLLQDIWKGKFDWDTPLPVVFRQKWLHIAADLNATMKTRIPRYYFSDADDVQDAADDNCKSSLHIFVDASTQSYGATAFLCKGNHSRLVMAKNRVAPVKTLTLPKLELMAAVIGARLSQHLSTALEIKKIYYWSDSQIVLHWLQQTENTNRFVRTRVSEIKLMTETKNWSYCQTQENPADLLTRGISAIQYQESKLWFTGPSWITDDTKWSKWDVRGSTVLAATTEETGSQPEKDTSSHTKIMQVIDVARFSKLQKVL